MGFLSSLKRLFFVQESLARSAAEKAKEFTKEKVEDVSSKGKEILNKAENVLSDKIKDMRENLSDVGESTIETVKNTAKEVESMAYTALDEISENEHVKRTAEFTEQLGDKILTAGEKFMEKISETAEKYRPAGEEALENAKNVAEGTGEKIIELKKEVVEKAKTLTAELGEKFDELAEKAVKESEELQNTPKNEFSDKTLDAGSSLLEDKDDFFAKAAKYAEGNYNFFDSVTGSDNEADTTNEYSADDVSPGNAKEFEAASVTEDKSNLPPLVMGDLSVDAIKEEE